MIRVMFVVQGEGRGHLTQAITLSEILRKHDYELVEVLVGKSKKRDLPDFFYEKIKAPVFRFFSPNFVPSKTHDRTSLVKSFIYNLPDFYRYFKSTLLIRKRIKELNADLVINFYDILAGMAYALFPPKVPFLCIGHQYMLLHPDFKFPSDENRAEIEALKYFTKWTCCHATGLLALSLRRMKNDCVHKIHVIPPLLRHEVFEQQVERGDYIHGYLLNDAYADQITGFHRMHPDIKMHFFWDRKNAEKTTVIDNNLIFHQLDDSLFLKYLAGCKAYATTAGFESVCEAIYLGKPVIMVPTHIEQACNAYDAGLAGAGIISDRFDLNALLQYIPVYKENKAFKDWENTSETHVIDVINKLLVSKSYSRP